MAAASAPYAYLLWGSERVSFLWLSYKSLRVLVQPHDSGVFEPPSCTRCSMSVGVAMGRLAGRNYLANGLNPDRLTSAPLQSDPHLTFSDRIRPDARAGPK